MEIAECFNDSFANIGEDLANKIAEKDVVEVQYISKVTQTLSRLNLTSKQFIEKLRTMNPKKAAGHDGITTKVLMVLADDRGVCLANICRQRYFERKLPSTWKIGKLKPALKTGQRDVRGNYHPLNMLPIAREMYEAVICNQLDDQED